MGRERTIASREQIAQLRNHYGDPTADYKYISKISSMTATFLLDTYGIFMTDSAAKIGQSIHERIVMVKNMKRLRQFSREYDGSTIIGKIIPIGFHTTKGDVIAVVNELDELWNAPGASEFRSLLIGRYHGSEKEAKRGFTLRSHINFVSHETIHALHADSLPQWFAEVGTAYYQLDMSQKLKLQSYTTKELVERAKIYRQLLDKYGDDVQSLFFGSRKDAPMIDQYAQIIPSDKYAQLFPEEISHSKLDFIFWALKYILLGKNN